MASVTMKGGFAFETISKISDAVTRLEVRGNLNPGLRACRLRTRFAGKLLYTRPIHPSNGPFDGPLSARHNALIQAAREYDMVGLEANCDLSPAMLAAIPAPKRLICWHGPGSDL